jgi:hypothetical protein
MVAFPARLFSASAHGKGVSGGGGEGGATRATAAAWPACHHTADPHMTQLDRLQGSQERHCRRASRVSDRRQDLCLHPRHLDADAQPWKSRIIWSNTWTQVCTRPDTMAGTRVYVGNLSNSIPDQEASERLIA